MSWSYSSRNETHDEAVASLDANTQLPQAIKDYARAGVEALRKSKPDRKVRVYGHGHVHTGEAGNLEETTATLTVSPEVAEV